MSKRIVALLLCLLMCVTALVGCTARIKASDDIKGAYITMYLTDEVYNFDPAYAYMNEEAESVVSLLFSRLFSLSSKGKLQYELAKEYEIVEDEKTKEYKMVITLKDAWWSDKIKLTADDVVFAWKRILNAENSFACASLLFDIKNARAVKAGNCSIDDLGVCALNDNTLEISFEKPIDYDQFLLNLTSLALAPLREDYVTKGDDWAKKPGTMVCSGPFKLNKIKYYTDKTVSYYDINGSTNDNGAAKPYESAKKEDQATYDLLVLERNLCYDRNPDEDDLDLNESVEPYRLIINFINTDEELLQALSGQLTLTYQERDDEGSLIQVDGNPVELTIRNNVYYMGTIPLSLRSNAELMEQANITDALSTMSFYLNEEVTIRNQSTGEEVALFANSAVRNALSLALNREEIADTLVLADAATGFVPTGLFNKGSKGDFRKEGGNLISTSPSMDAARQALSEANINASDYSFSITVNANDDAHIALAEMAVTAWTELGFTVEIVKRGTILNNDFYAPTTSVPTDLCDELYVENLYNRDYEVTIVDCCAYSVDAYSMLSSFAADFSGMVDEEFNMVTHLTGYNSEKYNALIEAIYYLPYINQVTAADYGAFMMYESAEAFQAVLDSVQAIYDEYGIDTSKPEDGRVKLLHEAEELLMTDMPVIPVVFNKNATVGTSELKGVKSDLYTAFDLTSARLKDYDTLVEELDRFYKDFDMVYYKRYKAN